MKQYKLFVLDLDGTLYRGSQPIEEARPFMEELKRRGQDYVFLTNNSTKTPEDVQAQLASFGIEAYPEQVYTTSMMTARFLVNKKKDPLVYVVGEKALRDALTMAGCQLVEEDEQLKQCDFVVVGLDRQVTYEKLAKATIAIREGATFISTNADKALPSERGLVPGNGALTALIQTATGRDPLFIGKPEPYMLEMILKEKGLSKDEVLVIGDNYETDIMTGIRAGVDTAIVFTGFTQPEDLAKVSQLPTYQWQTLLDAFAEDWKGSQPVK